MAQIKTQDPSQGLTRSDIVAKGYSYINAKLEVDNSSGASAKTIKIGTLLKVGADSKSVEIVEPVADFLTDKDYVQNDLVAYQGKVYKTKSGGAPKGAFDSTKFDTNPTNIVVDAVLGEIKDITVPKQTKKTYNVVAIIIGNFSRKNMVVGSAHEEFAKVMLQSKLPLVDI